MTRRRLTRSRCSGLVKRFGKTTALDGVDLTARRAGARPARAERRGKDHGGPQPRHAHPPGRRQATVLGYDVQRDAHQVRQLVGLTGQYASVDELLSGFNNLVMIGRLLGTRGGREAKARASELLERFDLTEAARRPAKTYSGGMRRRLDLAASLVGRPAGAVPRRADDRPGPAQPQRAVVHRPGADRRRRHRAAGPRSTWKRPTSCATTSR